MLLDNYREYRKNKPDYKEWENDRLAKEAKRVNYLKKNNINASNSTNDIERAKNILNAVDVMDEFSQSRAEEMEMTVQAAKGAISQISFYLGAGLAALSIKSQKVRDAIFNTIGKGGKINLSPELLIPAALFALPVLGSSILFSLFSAKQETKASRLGRAEAINKKLNSPKQFAILTDEQKKQAEEIAKNINVTEKDVKKHNNITKGAGILNSIKTIFAGDKESEAKLKELKEQAKVNDENIKNDKPLTPEQIEEAKKDKQLVQNVVEKIDIASQEYAEDVELATGTFQTLALGSGGLLGALTKFILSKTKLPDKKANSISTIIAVVVGLAGSLWATSLQKQASRVARFKVKQDFLANPEKLVYVDEDKIKNEPDVKVEPKKKPNFFKFLYQVYQNDKEYKQYKKESGAKQLKHSQALEKIELTPEQEKRARQLQNNVFKMFNKVDEKSQIYSESTEAIGEVVQTAGSLIGMIPGALGYVRSLKNKNAIMGIISLVGAMLPGILLNIFVTKEQKSASKVASMLAIKELDDYKHFADYSGDSVSFKKNEEKVEEKNKEVKNEQSSKKINVDEIIKQRLDGYRNKKN